MPLNNLLLKNLTSVLCNWNLCVPFEMRLALHQPQQRTIIIQSHLCDEMNHDTEQSRDDPFEFQQSFLSRTLMNKMHRFPFIRILFSALSRFPLGVGSSNTASPI